jgi:hypothetical protein
LEGIGKKSNRPRSFDRYIVARAVTILEKRSMTERERRVIEITRKDNRGPKEGISNRVRKR